MTGRERPTADLRRNRTQGSMSLRVRLRDSLRGTGINFCNPVGKDNRAGSAGKHIFLKALNFKHRFNL